jgi:hypothetical protein
MQVSVGDAVKKRARTLVVDGATYFWSYTYELLRPPAPESTIIHARVRGVFRLGAPLCVDCLIHHHGWIYLLPSDVRRMIDVALAAGWQPLQHGPDFRIPYEAVGTLDCEF